MKKKQILFAIVFGAMLAITGCGDDETSNGGDGGSSGSGGSGGTAGAGGSAGSGGTAGTGGSDGSFCGVVCNSCVAEAVAECAAACEQQLELIPPQFDVNSCPNEANDIGTCLSNNGCDTDACDGEYTAWAECVFIQF